MDIVKNRPINLNLFAFSFPITAIVSIFHRVSGVILFLALPIYLWLLGVSLSDVNGFERARHCLATFGMKCVTWCFVCTLIYHLLAGVRHIIMDFGFGESKEAGKRSAKGLIFFSLVCFILLGVWIW